MLLFRQEWVVSMVRFKNFVRLDGLAKKTAGLVVGYDSGNFGDGLVGSALCAGARRVGWTKFSGISSLGQENASSARSAVKKVNARRSHRSRHIRSIGRIDNARLKTKRKKLRSFHIPKAKTRRASQGGTYRTMCVRTCDGFYFPVSFSTTKGRLKKDANVCASRCGAAPARLYYYPNPGADIKDMVSYKGKQKYQKLKNAFLFTKEFVADCRCKPEPWTKEAKSKHQTYALLQAKTPCKKWQRAKNVRSVDVIRVEAKQGRIRNRGGDIAACPPKCAQGCVICANIGARTQVKRAIRRRFDPYAPWACGARAQR